MFTECGPAVGAYASAVPPKIQAAMDYLRFADNIRSNSPCYPGDTPKDDARQLSKAEAEVYDSALTQMLLYFESENIPPLSPMSAPPSPGDGEDPRRPVPVPVG